MITLTTEQAQQIEEIVEHLLVEHPTARHHKACVEALSIIRAARVQGPTNRDDKQLAEWLMRCPQTGKNLRFAGAPEQFGHMNRVRLQDSDGNDWTLTAGLQEGWMTEEQRVANIAISISEETEAARAQEQAEQEPVAFLTVGEFGGVSVSITSNAPVDVGRYPLHTAPVRTKNLTEAEIDEIWKKHSGGNLGFAYAVIDAGREKNK